jgi:hypothetical protein
MAQLFCSRAGADLEWGDCRRRCRPDPTRGRGLDHPGTDTRRLWGCYGHYPRAHTHIHPHTHLHLHPPVCYGVGDACSYRLTLCLSYCLFHPYLYSGAISGDTGLRGDPMQGSARLAPLHGPRRRNVSQYCLALWHHRVRAESGELSGSHGQAVRWPPDLRAVQQAPGLVQLHGAARGYPVLAGP